MEKIITYYGQKAKVGCDEKCNKAWGSSSRPKIQISDEDDDDFAFLSDEELGDAPIDPQTYEGGYGKPEDGETKLNKWCVRECERCTMSKPNEYDKPLKLEDFNKRQYNIWSHDPETFNKWLTYANGSKIESTSELESIISGISNEHKKLFSDSIYIGTLNLMKYVGEYFIKENGYVDGGVIKAVLTHN